MSMIIRVIVVVILAFFLSIIIPALLRILGINLTGDMILVLRACLGVLALFYIIFGQRYWPNPPIA